MKYLSLSRTLVITMLLLAAGCTFSLLPSNSEISFYDLTLDHTLFTDSDLCLSSSDAGHQIFLSKVDALTPYNGFRIYQIDESGLLLSFDKIQWISPLSSLYPAKLISLLSSACQQPNRIPMFTNNLTARSDAQAYITLTYARINSDSGSLFADAKVTASVRSESSGVLLNSTSGNGKVKSRQNPSQKDLMLALQEAIRLASIEALSEIIRQRY